MINQVCLCGWVLMQMDNQVGGEELTRMVNQVCLCGWGLMHMDNQVGGEGRW